MPKLPATNTADGATMENVGKGAHSKNYDWCQQNCTGYFNKKSGKATTLLNSACKYICGCLEKDGNGVKITSNLLGCGGTGTMQNGHVPFSSFCAPNIIKSKVSVKENFGSTRTQGIEKCEARATPPFGDCGTCIMNNLHTYYPKQDFCCNRQGKNCGAGEGSCGVLPGSCESWPGCCIFTPTLQPKVLEILNGNCKKTCLDQAEVPPNIQNIFY